MLCCLILAFCFVSHCTHYIICSFCQCVKFSMQQTVSRYLHAVTIYYFFALQTIKKHPKMPPPGVCLDIIKERQSSDGVGTLKNPKNLWNQNYESLLQYHLAGQWRFKDDMFPPDRTSIGENLLSEVDLALVEWIRPTVHQHNEIDDSVIN